MANLNTVNKKTTPQKKGPQKKKGLGTTTGILISAIVLVLIAAVAIGVIAIKVGSQDGIYKGVTVSGIDVGGLSRREAEQKLIEQMGTVSENKSFNVIIGDYTFNLTSEDFNMKYDAALAAAEAYHYGRNGSKLKNLMDILKASSGGYEVPFSVTYDTTSIADLAKEIADEVNVNGAESSYTVEETFVIVTVGRTGYKITADEIQKAIEDRFNGVTNGDVVLNPETSEDEGIDLAKIKEEITTEAEDAYIDETDPNNPVLVPEVLGRTLDLTEAEKILAGEGEGPKKNIYRLPYAEVKPEVMREDLKFFTFNDLLSSSTTYLNAGNKNRTTNIKLACEKINGTILYPGDEFSFNDTVGERTYAAGFKDATIYLSGELADGVGGGICQVSSTMYVCSVGADLQISERHNHRYTVTYVKLGMDATVAYDSKIDYKFVNNTENAIKIKIVQESNYIKCEFYGTLTEENKNKTTSMAYTVLSSTPFGVKYVVDDSIAAGTTSKKNSGYIGYSVKTYRVTKVNGEEVSRVLENTSKYSSLDETYLINSIDAGEDAEGNVTYEPVIASPSPSVEPTTEPTTTPSTTPSTVPSTEPSTTPSTDPSTEPSPDDGGQPDWLDN